MGIQENVSEILEETTETRNAEGIEAILDPHGEKPYPMNHVGDFSRFPEETRWDWINAAKLKDAFACMDSGIERVDVHDFKEMVNPPLDNRGDVKYKGEWISVQQLGHIKNIIAENPAAAEANKIIANKIIPAVIEKLRNGGIYRLLDLGIGELGMRKNLHIIGVDVMDDARRISKDMLTSSNPEYGGLPSENIHMIEAMFGQLHKNEEIIIYKGKIDGAVSGAAIHHQANIDPFFKFVYSLLSPQGQLEIWDWLHWLWVGEIVKVGKGGNVPELYKEGLKQMVKVWIGLHGYSDDYKAIIEKDFYESIYTVGFNFHSLMEKYLVGAEILDEKKTEFQSAEGHRPPEIYTRVIDHYFGNVDHYQIGDLIKDQEIPTAVLLHGFSAIKAEGMAPEIV